METVIRKGIAISIDAKQHGKTRSFVLTGSTKQWEFTAFEKRNNTYTVMGYVHRYAPRKVKGETTLLAEEGRKQLQKLSNEQNVLVVYPFQTENRELIRWYLGKGRRALGINRGETYQSGRLVALRVFSPQPENQQGTFQKLRGLFRRRVGNLAQGIVKAL